MHANEFQLRPTDKMGRSGTVFIFIDMAFGLRSLISPVVFGVVASVVNLRKIFVLF